MIEQTNIIIPIANMALTAGLAIYTFIGRRNRATTQSIIDLGKQINEKLEAKCIRIGKLEASIASMPERDEIVRVHERIETLCKDINENNKEINLMLGKLLGQVEQMNRGHS